MTVAGDILRDTAEIVDGARDKVHGDKERSFETIAQLWCGYLFNKRVGPGIDGPHTFHGILPEDVAILMALVKIGRICHGIPVRDHYMDAAGYMAIAGELAGEFLQETNLTAEKKYEEDVCDCSVCANAPDICCLSR